MESEPNFFEPVRDYFENTLKTHGTTAKGMDWNSEQARELRFEQLVKIVQPGAPFSLLDYGSGYGAFADYLLAKGLPVEQYVGYDLLESMVIAGREAHAGQENVVFAERFEDVPEVDYVVACGVFNMKLDVSVGEWNHFVLRSLHEMNSRGRKGFSVNFLTKYSDADRMRPDLYYADPCFLFDYCKLNFSKNVALLHDYNLYDFTLLIRK